MNLNAIINQLCRVSSRSRQHKQPVSSEELPFHLGVNFCNFWWTLTKLVPYFCCNLYNVGSCWIVWNMCEIFFNALIVCQIAGYHQCIKLPQDESLSLFIGSSLVSSNLLYMFALYHFSLETPFLYLLDYVSLVVPTSTMFYFSLQQVPHQKPLRSLYIPEWICKGRCHKCSEKPVYADPNAVENIQLLLQRQCCDTNLKAFPRPMVGRSHQVLPYCNVDAERSFRSIVPTPFNRILAL